MSQSDGPECCICLQLLFDPETTTDNFVDDTEKSEVGVLPCGHILHFSCGLQHLEHRRQCPICRASFDKRDSVESTMTVLRVARNAPTANNEVGEDPYMAQLSQSCNELKRKGEILKQRMELMVSKEGEMKAVVKRLSEEHQIALRTEAILRGRWCQELTARAEAEQLKQLQQCAIDTRQQLIDARQTHAELLRQVNELGEKTEKIKQRLQEEFFASGRSKRLRSEFLV